MTVDRYTKLILTVIALELGWIAINGTGVPLLAQRSEATPVVIRGVEGPPGKQPLIPVTVMGSTILRVESERPLEVISSRPLKIEADRPIPVETGNEPLLIRTVSDPPANRPGVAPGAFKP
jgi:hypothetical protein